MSSIQKEMEIIKPNAAEIIGVLAVAITEVLPLIEGCKEMEPWRRTKIRQIIADARRHYDAYINFPKIELTALGGTGWTPKDKNDREKRELICNIDAETPRLCRNCKFWQVVELNSIGVCINDLASLGTLHNGFAFSVFADFGCVHFEVKNVNE